MNRIPFQITTCLIINLCLLSPLTLHAQDLAISGNLSVTGTTLLGTTTGSIVKLQVGSGSGLDASAISFFYGTGTSGGVISIGANDASKQAEVGVDGTAGFLTTKSNQPIQLRPNNTTAMTVLANGNVGIGTSSPSQRLQVNAAADTGAGLFLTTNTSWAAGKDVSLFLGDTTHYIKSVFSSPDLWSSYHGQQFIDSGGTIMTVGYNGGANVGIGTTAPGVLFHVSGNFGPLVFVDIYGNGSALGANSVIGRGARGTVGSPTAVQTNDILAGIAGRGYGSTGFGANSTATISLVAAQNFTDTSQSTYIKFSTTASGTVIGVEQMRLDQNGNLGVGTTSPAAKLEVNGTTKLDSGLTTTGTATISGTVTAPLYITTTAAGDIPMFGH